VRSLTNTREFLHYIHDYIEVFQKRQRSLLIWLSEGCFIKIKAQYFGKEKVGTLPSFCAKFRRVEGDESMIKVMGERLRKLRKNLGLTQKQFAEKVPGKVDYTYIGKIERGQQYPSLKMLEKIGKAFSVPLGYFCDEDMPSKLLNLLPSDILSLIQDEERQDLLKLSLRLTRRDFSVLMQMARILAQGEELRETGSASADRI